MLRKIIAVMAISVLALQMIAEEDLLLSRSMNADEFNDCLLYTSPSPRDAHESRMPSSA